MLITIVWNPSGFCIVTALPKGLKFNACYDTREILQEIKNWREQQGVGDDRILSVHSDNARPHTAKLSMDFLNANGMRKAPHPPYSPGLAPTDSLLFGDVKRQLSGCAFNSAADLLAAVHHILDGYDRLTLISVFEEWMRRLRQCVDTEGDYIE
jgi:hypothetical protein